MGDLVLLFVGIIAALFMLDMDRGFDKSVAIVSVRGEDVRTLPLDAPDGMFTFTDGGVTYTLERKETAIAMAVIDCPDQICVRTGFIRDGHIPIACLPNRLIVRVEKGG